MASRRRPPTRTDRPRRTGGPPRAPRARAARALARRPWLGVLALALLVAVAFVAGRFGADSQPVEPHQARVSADGAETDTVRATPRTPRAAPDVPTDAQAMPDPLQPPATPLAVPDRPVAEAPPPPAAPTAPATHEPPAPAPATVRTAALPPPPMPPDAPLWRRNAVPPPPADGRPRVVIVIDDMGVDRKRSGRIAALPGPLTLAWLPYARDLPAQAAAARRRGHELIVHVPMEPAGGEDPGPGALLTRLAPEELRRRLTANLAAFDGYVGINNHMGSRFTADRMGMAVVMAELSARGLLFLDSRTTAETQAPALAETYRLPVLSRDVFLDHVQTAKGVAAALAKLEEVARRDGVAIAIGHPYDVTAAALEAWLPTLEAKGLRLIPLSAAVPANREGW